MAYASQYTAYSRWEKIDADQPVVVTSGAQASKIFGYLKDHLYALGNPHDDTSKFSELDACLITNWLSTGVRASNQDWADKRLSADAHCDQSSDVWKPNYWGTRSVAQAMSHAQSKLPPEVYSRLLKLGQNKERKADKSLKDNLDQELADKYPWIGPLALAVIGFVALRALSRN